MSAADASGDTEDQDEGQNTTVSTEDAPSPAFEVKADEPATSPAAEPRKTKAERRAERGQGYAQEAARLRQESIAQQAENRRLGEMIANIQGQLSARQTGQNIDPRAAQLHGMRSKIEQTVARMGTGDAAAVAEWHELRAQEADLIADMRYDQRRSQDQANQPKPLDPILATVAAKYDWITTDHEARQYAEGQVAKLVRQEKRNMNDPAIRRTTLLEAAAITERDLNMPGATAAPSESQRQRYQGTTGSAGGAGQGAQGGQMVALNDEQRALAQAAFRHLEPKQAWEEWWKQIGAKIRNK